jgi:hypothetical protein
MNDYFMRLVMLAALSFVTLCALPTSMSAQSPDKPTYEVYALSYGVFPDYAVSNLIAGADKDRKLDLQMMIWLIKGSGGKNILVDTGCYHEKVIHGKNIKNFIKPSETLAKLADSNLKALDRMMQIASRPNLIVPGHDPEVFVKFPKPGNGVARIQ